MDCGCRASCLVCVSNSTNYIKFILGCSRHSQTVATFLDYSTTAPVWYQRPRTSTFQSCLPLTLFFVVLGLLCKGILNGKIRSTKNSQPILRSLQALGITFQNILMYLSKPSLLQALGIQPRWMKRFWDSCGNRTCHHPWLSPLSQGPFQENFKKQLHWQENIQDHSSYTCSRFWCPACHSLQEIDLHAGPAELLWQLSSKQIKYS